jgi:hypothetical protein
MRLIILSSQETEKMLTKFKNLWIKHLTENSMSYFEHMFFALLYSGLCFLASIYLLIHAIFPCFYQTAGSDLVKMLASVFKKRSRIDDT